MFKQTFHFEELKCHDCALAIVEKIEKYDFIKKVYIDFDSNNIILESDIVVKRSDVEKEVESIVAQNHEGKHGNYLSNIQNIVTDEYHIEQLEDYDSAKEVEEELNKVEDIVGAEVNLSSKTVYIKHLNNVEVYNIVSKIVSQVNKEAVLSKEEDVHDDHDHDHHHEHEHEHEHHHHHEHHHEHHSHDCACGCDFGHMEQDYSSSPFVITKEEEREGIVLSKFNFEEIDCPNCAAKVERALNKSDAIIEARVNFIAKTIIVKHIKNDLIFDIVSKILKDNEPDAYLVSKDYSPIEDKNYKKIDFLKKLITCCGIALFIIGLVILHIGDEEITGYLGFKPILEGPFYTVPLFISFIGAYICLAYDLIYKSIHGILHGDVFNESLLMVVASMGALSLSFFGEYEFVEACSVILLYKIGEYFQAKATDKSKKAIKELIEMKSDTVTLKDGTIKNVNEVGVGEIITVKVGEQIPLDGIITQGETNLDTKALTGESVPIYVKEGIEILSGSINLTKVIDVEVTKIDSESTMTKVLKLVEEATNQKSKSEEFITKFARIYTPAILIIALIIGIVEAITGYGIPDGMTNIQGALNNVFSILVISCPCALVISIPLGYFAGIGRFSASGILVKGGNYIEALALSQTFVFDKTGTITKGNFKVSDIVPAKNHTQEEVLEIIAQTEQFSMHPIANSIKEAYQKEVKKLDNASVEEIAGAGIKMKVDQKVILVGNDKMMKKFRIKYDRYKSVGTILYLVVNEEFYGCVVINDEIKPEAKELIDYLNKKNYRSVMLTGDNEDVAKSVAKKVGIKDYKAKILPHEKYLELESIMKESDSKVCYIGDGINDTPSLRRADVGIAMGAVGSDSAKECADVVIMNDDLSKIIDAIEISKYTRKIVFENIIFALATKLFALLVITTGILDKWSMVISLFADVGVCIIAILNVLRILKYKLKK